MRNRNVAGNAGETGVVTGVRLTCIAPLMARFLVRVRLLHSIKIKSVALGTEQTGAPAVLVQAHIIQSPKLTVDRPIRPAPVPTQHKPVG